MYAWFAPAGIILLLPYTLFDFTRATYYWFLTNIAVVFSGTQAPRHQWMDHFDRKPRCTMGQQQMCITSALYGLFVCHLQYTPIASLFLW